MRTEILLNTLGELRRCGLISTNREYAALLGKNAQWVRDLQRDDGRAIRDVRQTTAMRLRRRLLDWKQVAPLPVGERLTKIIEKIDAEDTTARWMARGR